MFVLICFVVIVYLVLDMNYTFRKAKFKDDFPLNAGFWVSIYFLFDGERTYTMFDQAACFDNYLLMLESGSNVNMFHKEILVTPYHFSSIYNQIIENYVSESSIN